MIGSVLVANRGEIAAAAEAGADAVDPGYGLLSEDPGFARAVAAAGLVFVGRPAAAIAAMGDKPAARAIARRAGVPVLPGSGVIGHPEQGLSEAARLGYPVLVKAVEIRTSHGPFRVPVTAPWPGEVRALLVAEGDSVTAGQPLAEIAR